MYWILQMIVIVIAHAKIFHEYFSLKNVILIVAEGINSIPIFLYMDADEAT